MVGIAQLVERLVVVQDVAGSSPVTHPISPLEKQMKQFLINVLDSNTGTATGDEIAEIDAFNEMLQNNGHWVYANGISAPAEAVKIDNRNDKDELVDGPLYDEETYVSGFWIIKAEDKNQAIALAKLGSKACNRRVELRPLHG